MRRALVVILTVAVLGIAVPASAASWRGYASVRADGFGGSGPHVAILGMARKIQDIRIGFYTYGSARTVTYDYEWFCDGNTVSRTGRTTSTAVRTWKWVVVRDSSTTKNCVFDTFAHTGGGTMRVKVQVR